MARRTLPDLKKAVKQSASDYAIDRFTGGGESAEVQGISEISIAEIAVLDQFRTYFDDDELFKLQKSIDKDGFQGSITVKNITNDERNQAKEKLRKAKKSERLSAKEIDAQVAKYKYRLITGETRLRAMKALEKETIPADIKNEDLDIQAIHRIQADENLVRNDLNALEEHECLLQMMADAAECTKGEAETLIHKIRNHGEKSASQDELTAYSNMQQVISDYKGENTNTKPKTLLTTLLELRKFEGPRLEALQRKVSYSKLRLLSKLTEEQQRDVIKRIEAEDLTVTEVKSITSELLQPSQISDEISQDVLTRKTKAASQSKKQSATVNNDTVPVELKAAVKHLTAKKMWEKISADTLRLKRAEALLEELNKLISDVDGN